MRRTTTSALLALLGLFALAPRAWAEDSIPASVDDVLEVDQVPQRERLVEPVVLLEGLDRGGVGSGTSHGNCGMISPSQAAPIAIPGLIPKALKWMWKPDAPLYIKPTLNPKRLAWLWRFARRCASACRRGSLALQAMPATPCTSRLFPTATWS